MIQKIYYVYDRATDAFLGYIVGTSDEDAATKAQALAGKPKDQLRVEDTGKTKPKCCPRK